MSNEIEDRQSETNDQEVAARARRDVNSGGDASRRGWKARDKKKVLDAQVSSMEEVVGYELDETCGKVKGIGDGST